MARGPTQQRRKRRDKSQGAATPTTSTRSETKGESHPSLVASVQTQFGNRFTSDALSGQEQGPGQVIEQAMRWGSDGKPVTDDVGDLLQADRLREWGTPTGQVVAAALQEGGSPLPTDVRLELEQALGGVDLGGVRIHTSGVAGRAASALDASAFATGQHIFFAPGAYAPGTPQGKFLLAHELAHTTQTSANASGNIDGVAVSEGSDGHERQAEQVAARVASGKVAPLGRAKAAMGKALHRRATFAPIPWVRPAGPEYPAVPPGFSAKKKAQELFDAIDGWGTDEEAIFDILSTGRRDLTVAIYTAYNAKHGNLVQDLASDLTADEMAKAVKLLTQTRLSLKDKLWEAVDGWGTDEQAIFHAIDRAPPGEVLALRSDQPLLKALKKDLNGAEWALVQALMTGTGRLAAELRLAVKGLGTDEEFMWVALARASQEEKNAVVACPDLLRDVFKDLSESESLQFSRMLRGTLNNVDRIEIAVKGWGTDEDGLQAALDNLTEEEIKSQSTEKWEYLIGLIERDLGASRESTAFESLHQKRLQWDLGYRKQKLGFAVGPDGQLVPGATVMLGKGGAPSVVGQLKIAAAGAGTNESDVWAALLALTPEERSFLKTYNPEGVLDLLRADLTKFEWASVAALLSGSTAGVVTRMEAAFYDNDHAVQYALLERIAADGDARAALSSSHCRRFIPLLPPGRQEIWNTVLEGGELTPLMRLRWASTARDGTDEDLVWKLCVEHRSLWWKGKGVDPEVDAILKSELDKVDYWRAFDSMRPEATTEEEKLARSHEMLMRERQGDFGAAFSDAFSYTGNNANEAWRDYQVSYNQSYDDGKVSADEEKLLRRDEKFSAEKTQQYSESKRAVASWATMIAVTIVGIVATILTGGVAGPFVLALGGKLAVAAQAMVLAAALKVGINKALIGEGYNLSSAQTFRDALGAALEVGTGITAAKFGAWAMTGLQESGRAAKMVGFLEKGFGRAGKIIYEHGVSNVIENTAANAQLAAVDAMNGDVVASLENFGTGTVMGMAVGTTQVGLTVLTKAGLRSIARVFKPMHGADLDAPGLLPVEDVAIPEMPAGELNLEADPTLVEPQAVKAQTVKPKLVQPEANTQLLLPEGKKPLLLPEHAESLKKKTTPDAPDFGPDDGTHTESSKLSDGIAPKAVANPTALEKHADFQWKRLEGVAFGKNADGTMRISFKDTDQNEIGDCWYMARMIAVAHKKPHLIQQLIKENGNGTADVVLWTYERGRLVPIAQTLDYQFLVKNGDQLVYAGADKDAQGMLILWGPLLEKRLAQHKGSYTKIQGGEWFGSDGFDHLTGMKSTKANVASRDSKGLLNELRQSVDRPMVAEIYDPGAASEKVKAMLLKLDVIGNHAYVVDDVTADGTVTLINPWGHRHPKPMSWDDFRVVVEEVVYTKGREPIIDHNDVQS